MIKLEMRNRESYYFNLGTFIYQVLGIKERRLYLNLLEFKPDKKEAKKGFWCRQKPSFKIYYKVNLGNYIINPETKEEISIDNILKKFFNEFYLKGE